MSIAISGSLFLKCPISLGVSLAQLQISYFSTKRLSDFEVLKCCGITHVPEDYSYGPKYLEFLNSDKYFKTITKFAALLNRYAFET